MMKKTVFLFLAILMTASLRAAESPWLTSLPEAEALAKKVNKPVLVDFTGSDWCIGCKRLENDVFSKSDFLNYARKRLVLVQLDYPLDKPQTPALRKTNEALQEQFKIEGFPTLLLMKPDGTVLWRQEGYLDGGPPAMIEALNKAWKS